MDTPEPLTLNDEARFTTGRTFKKRIWSKPLARLSRISIGAEGQTLYQSVTGLRHLREVQELGLQPLPQWHPQRVPQGENEGSRDIT